MMISLVISCYWVSFIGSSVESIDFAAHAEALKNALNKLAFTEEHNSPFGETCRDEDQGV